MGPGKTSQLCASKHSDAGSFRSEIKPMVHISHESIAETEARLLRVMQQARLKVYADVYGFEEFPLDAFAARARSDALALVRDDAVWSQLAPGDGPGERFRIFRFHFPEGVDNSGFVGWLASRLKLEFGTGVFVICGQNSGDGGIFDYWGVPEMLGEVVIAYVRKLCASEADLAQGRRGY
ncbi:MAG: DUF6196 family protein [Phenylobacterium sp.]